MGESTIRVSQAAKGTLEALRRRWQQALGRKVSQSEAAARAFSLVAAHPDLDAAGSRWTAAQWRSFEAGIVADPNARSDDIDAVLYGDQA
jgi:hypothetical protein